MPEPGSVIAGYRIEGILGRGGMGVVYEAVQLSLNRRVALKLLGAQFGEDPAFRQRFQQEGMTQASIDHPHIVTVYEAGESPEGLYIAMRLVQGFTVKDLIVSGEMDVDRTLRILTPIADALDTAHSVGLIHRDIKPQNILVDVRDHAFLADFGLTKGMEQPGLTKTGQFVGTIDYICPEQIRGERTTPSSDIYALGALLYECLTGVVPFMRQNDAAVLYAHLSDEPPPVTAARPELPQGLDRVIARAMAKDPAERHPTASELMNDARRAAGRPSGGTIEAPVLPVPGDTLIDRPRLAGPTVIGESAERTRADSTAPRTVPQAASETVPQTVPHLSPSLEVPHASEPTLVDAVAASSGTTQVAHDSADTVAGRSPATSGGAPQGRVALAAAAVALVAAAAVGGVLLGRSGDTAPPAPPAPALTSSASAGALRVAYPGTWEPRATFAGVPGLSFREAVGVGPQGDAEGELVLGQTDAVGPTLLPASLLSRLERPPATDDRVRLGELDAYRYRGLQVRDFPRALTLYVTPTSTGIATIACHAEPARAEAYLPECERAATSLVLLRGDAMTLGPDAAYGRVLEQTLRTLGTAQVNGRKALAGATTQAAQAGASEALAKSYTTAATRLAGARPGPADRIVGAAIVAALNRTGSAYTAMARAARGDDRSGFGKAKATARSGQQALTTALAGLAPLGYTRPAG